MNLICQRLRCRAHLRGEIADVAFARHRVAFSKDRGTGSFRVSIPPLFRKLRRSLRNKKLLKGHALAKPCAKTVTLTLLLLHHFGATLGVVRGQQTSGNIQRITGPFTALKENALSNVASFGLSHS